MTELGNKNNFLRKIVQVVVGKDIFSCISYFWHEYQVLILCMMDFGEQLETIYFHNISSYVEIMTYGEFQLPMMSSKNYSGLRRVRSQI